MREKRVSTPSIPRTVHAISLIGWAVSRYGRTRDLAALANRGSVPRPILHFRSYRLSALDRHSISADSSASPFHHSIFASAKFHSKAPLGELFSWALGSAVDIELAAL